MAFGENDCLYRLGCDYNVYLGQKKLGNNKALSISASNDALWIVDLETVKVYKYDEKSENFQQKGNR